VPSPRDSEHRAPRGSFVGARIALQSFQPSDTNEP